MKKKAGITSVLALFGTMAMAQATLPSSEDFNSFTGTFSQAGWSFNNVNGGAANYTTGGVSNTACGKLDATGEYVQVFVGGQMGAVTYYLEGTSINSTWSGTFDVQESIDGSSWSSMANFTNNLSVTSINQFTVNPTSTSRYIRWYFTAKVSGYNVRIDNINISAGVPTEQDINVKYGTTTVLTGGTTPIFSSPVSTGTPVNFTVENLGLATLNVSSVAITGVDAADYVVTSPVGGFAVGSTSNQALQLTFTPSASGTRYADLEITSDDPDEGTYIIHLYGVGGSLASEPTGQASALTFTGIKSYRAQYSFAAASGSLDGYIILRKNSAGAITDVPVDGTWYQKGDQIGECKVYYIGSSLSGYLYNVWAGSDYELAVFTYNGNGVYTNYNTTSPATNGFTSSPVTMRVPSYYTGITTGSATFIDDLHNLINPHLSFYYSNYTITMINLFEARDTANNQKFVDCRYSGYKAVYTPPFDWTAQDFSREHSYCHNWMPTNPADGSGSAPNNVERPEYNDQHHLFPVKFTNVNDTRSNYPLGEVVGTPISTFMGAKLGFDAAGHVVYEPRDDQKGNSARAIMYVAVCYNGVNDAYGVAQNWKLRDTISYPFPNIPYGQDQTVLKKWHYQDPPDAYEIARNDFLDSLQHNRNPFIDSMQYACYIDFYTMTKISTPTIPCNISTVGLNEKYNIEYDFNLFPNPSNGTFNVLLNTPNDGAFTFNVIDVLGKKVESKTIDAKEGSNYVSFDKSNLPAGSYFVEVISNQNKAVKKLIIQ